MKVRFSAESHPGRSRRVNEDFLYRKKISAEEYLFIVADGMGGHRAGSVASKLSTETFASSYGQLRKTGKKVGESMVRSLRKANDAVLEYAAHDPRRRGMGTTFTACAIVGHTATIVHLGDSRLYLIRGKRLRRITIDHTYVERMQKEGRLTAKQARDHPQKNILYMSLGGRDDYVPQIIPKLAVRAGDFIVLCSDGLTNMVADRQIKETVTAHSPRQAVKTLIKLANDNGGLDNITVQVIHLDHEKETRPSKSGAKNKGKKSPSRTSRRKKPRKKGEVSSHTGRRI